MDSEVKKILDKMPESIRIDTLGARNQMREDLLIYGVSYCRYVIKDGILTAERVDPKEVDTRLSALSEEEHEG